MSFWKNKGGSDSRIASHISGGKWGNGATEEAMTGSQDGVRGHREEQVESFISKYKTQGGKKRRGRQGESIKYGQEMVEEPC